MRKLARLLDDRSYPEHLNEYMPTAEDKKLLLDIIANEKKWIKEERKVLATRYRALANPGSRQSICKRFLHYLRAIECAKYVILLEQT